MQWITTDQTLGVSFTLFKQHFLFILNNLKKKNIKKSTTPKNSSKLVALEMLMFWWTWICPEVLFFFCRGREFAVVFVSVVPCVFLFLFVFLGGLRKKPVRHKKIKVWVCTSSPYRLHTDTVRGPLRKIYPRCWSKIRSQLVRLVVQRQLLLLQPPVRESGSLWRSSVFVTLWDRWTVIDGTVCSNTWWRFV